MRKRQLFNYYDDFEANQFEAYDDGKIDENRFVVDKNGIRRRVMI